MPATIFSGNRVKHLKDEAQLGTDGASRISRSVDPTSVAVDAFRGTMLQNPTSGLWYRKLDDGSSTNWELQSSATSNDLLSLNNLGLDTSVAASALTIDLVQADGSTDPSSSAPVDIGFRSSTLTSGAVGTVSATAATTLVVPSGATLGTLDGEDAYLYVYALNNSGTIELAISSTLFDEGSTQSTVAITAGADDGDLYSTTLRSNVPIRLIGRLLSNQTTAGTWAADMDEISITSPAMSKPSRIETIITSTTTTTAADTWTTVTGSTVRLPSGGPWKVGYDISLWLEHISTTFTYLANARLYDNTNAAGIEGTIRLCQMTMSTSILDVQFPTSASKEIITSVPIDVVLQIRSGVANTVGQLNVTGTGFSGGLTDPDLENVVWAERP